MTLEVSAAAKECHHLIFFWWSLFQKKYSFRNSLLAKHPRKHEHRHVMLMFSTSVLPRARCEFWYLFYIFWKWHCQKGIKGRRFSAEATLEVHYNKKPKSGTRRWKFAVIQCPRLAVNKFGPTAGKCYAFWKSSTMMTLRNPILKGATLAQWWFELFERVSWPMTLKKVIFRSRFEKHTSWIFFHKLFNSSFKVIGPTCTGVLITISVCVRVFVLSTCIYAYMHEYRYICMHTVHDVRMQSSRTCIYKHRHLHMMTVKTMKRGGYMVNLYQPMCYQICLLQQGGDWNE